MYTNFANRLFRCYICDNVQKYVIQFSLERYKLMSRTAHRAAQNGTMYALTSSDINRFPKLFHCQNQEKICNNTVTKDLTTPQVCRYTTL